MWICGECGRLNDIQDERCECEGKIEPAPEGCENCADRASIFCHRAVIDYIEENNGG